MLGHWEDESIFPMMASLGPPLNFALYLRGNIDGGDRYALVNLGFYTADWLGWSLRALRLPVLVAGALSVLIFAVIAGRSFGFWAGVFGGLALALNPMFLVFWHQQIIVMITMLFLLLVIERYLQIETSCSRRRSYWWTVATLALAFTFLLLHYAVGRVYGAAIIGYWAALVSWRAIRAWRTQQPIDWRALLAVPVFGLLVAAFFVLLDPTNAQYLAAPHQIFFPPIGEYARGSGDLGVVLQNLPIMLTMVVPPLNLVPERFGEYSTDLMVDYRYAVVPTVMLPLVVLGLGVVVSRARSSAAARLTLMLLVVTFFGPLLSSQVGPYLSIASYRTFYTVIPLYLCAAAGVGWLLEHRLQMVRRGAVGLLVALLVIQAWMLGAEIGRHRAFIADLAERWNPSLGVRVFEGPAERRVTQEDEYLMNGSYRQYVDAGAVPSLVGAQRIVSTAQGPEGPDEVVIVRLEGTIPGGEALGMPALVFYLHELGVPAAMFDARKEQIRGAGWRRPAYVLAVNDRAAREARDRLRRPG